MLYLSQHYYFQLKCNFLIFSDDEIFVVSQIFFHFQIFLDLQIFFYFQIFFDLQIFFYFPIFLDLQIFYYFVIFQFFHFQISSISKFYLCYLFIYISEKTKFENRRKLKMKKLENNEIIENLQIEYLEIK